MSKIPFLALLAALVFSTGVTACVNHDDGAATAPPSEDPGSLGAADGAGSGSGVTDLAFDGSFSDPRPSRPLVAGDSVKIAFDAARWQPIIEWADGQGHVLSNEYGCGGDTCCELTVPGARLNYRFDTGAFRSAALGTSGTVTISLPADARALELYFDAPTFDLRKWACNCDQTCSQHNYDAASPEHEMLATYDSHFGHNYVFPVSARTTDGAITFGSNLGYDPAVTGTLRRGGAVRVQFDKSRFQQIINSTNQFGGYFAQSFHCYGYGCCDVQFPTVTAHYRFKGTDGWTNTSLDPTNGVSLDVPHDADRVELWFDTTAFQIQTWYCGCDDACANDARSHASYSSHDYHAYDSKFGANYVFGVR